MLPNKFVILWDGITVGVDRDSGGYPFKAYSSIPTKCSNPTCTKFWDTKEEAQRYIDIFRNSKSYEFHVPYLKIVEIQFRIVE